MVLMEHVSSEQARTGILRSRTRSRACQRCRFNHKKCDFRPRDNTCTNCKDAGTACKGGGTSELRFRHVDPGQAHHQSQQSPYSRQTGASKVTPHNKKREGPLTTADELSDTVPEDSLATSPPISQISAQSTPVDSSFQQPLINHELPVLGPIQDKSHTQAPQDLTNRYSKSSPPCLQDCTGPTIFEAANARSPAGGAIFLDKEASNFCNSSDECTIENTYIDTQQPGHLADDEARLIKHFFDVLLPWFDYCWVRAPFRSFIQSRLFQDLGLLYTVLAVAARHREATEDVYCKSNEYERECLAILIPTLNNNHETQSEDDGILVSALILRLLDEMTDPTGRRPVIRHIVSAPLLLRIRQHDPHPSETSDAAMAIVLRQEIYVANMTKRPVELNGYDCGIDDSFDTASDVTWMLRIMSHAARVTSFAYKIESRTDAIWDRHLAYLEEWEQKKPVSFLSLNGEYPSREKRDSSFPSLYYYNDCAIAARQYFEICKIILLASDPRVPALGIGRRKYMALQEEHMRNGTRTICGIWLSNQRYVSARSLAGLAIAMTGELFTDPPEIKQLLEIIDEAERHVAWPELKAGPQLRDFWM
ncbi:hypothetical protein NM208_g7649 [Fusarium decemcellulare]|uniref:Uncharacterized protein n=1 Tax=Fusarium decemcellulare TaxID=57161 RepID=A0ACC1S8B6_9HYPO|nr:hypothetical protein NM208_g7649 [Fusarium decemcellulare]